MAHLNEEFRKTLEASPLCFPPPAILGVGTSGGVSFVLEDRQGRGNEFLAQLDKYMAALRKRPEFSSVFTIALPSVPQVLRERGPGPGAEPG